MRSHKTSYTYSGEKNTNGGIETENQKLIELRQKWEGDLIVLAAKEKDETHLVLLKDLNDNSYRMHRYFKLMDDWLISVDMEDSHAEYALKHLFEMLEI